MITRPRYILFPSAPHETHLCSTPEGMPPEQEIHELRMQHGHLDVEAYIGFIFEETELTALMADLELDLVNAMTNRLRALLNANIMPRAPADLDRTILREQLVEVLFLHLSEDGKTLFFVQSAHRIG